jgi:hypothetical protein
MPVVIHRVECDPGSFSIVQWLMEYVTTRHPGNRQLRRYEVEVVVLHVYMPNMAKSAPSGGRPGRGDQKYSTPCTFVINIPLAGLLPGGEGIHFLTQAKVFRTSTPGITGHQTHRRNVYGSTSGEPKQLAIKNRALPGFQYCQYAAVIAAG